MKKNKNEKNEQIFVDIIVSDSSNIRRRKSRTDIQQKKEKSRNDIFRRLVRTSSDKKAPKTLRTKAYYRFSKDYPSVVTPDGFRENTEKNQKLTLKGKILLTVSVMLVFIISFVGGSVCLELSSRPADELYPTDTDADTRLISGLHFTPDELKSLSADDIELRLQDSGCNLAVFEFKNEYGYIYFDVNSSLGASADRKISDAWDKITALTEKGIDCAAYISCFKDTAAAAALSGMEIRTSSGELFSDSGNNYWLDPFSASARQYVLDQIKKASDGGFRHIILDNVAFPTVYSVSSPVYPSDDKSRDKNTVLLDFINDACKQAGVDKIITLCDISGFIQLSEMPNEKYGGTLLNTSCNFYAADLRADKQYHEQLENTKLFNFVDEMPLSFILDAGSLAVKQVKNEKENGTSLAIIDSSLENAEEYALNSGIKNIIIW